MSAANRQLTFKIKTTLGKSIANATCMWCVVYHQCHTHIHTHTHTHTKQMTLFSVYLWDMTGRNLILWLLSLVDRVTHH